MPPHGWLQLPPQIEFALESSVSLDSYAVKLMKISVGVSIWVFACSCLESVRQKMISLSFWHIALSVHAPPIGSRRGAAKFSQRTWVYLRWILFCPIGHEMICGNKKDTIPPEREHLCLCFVKIIFCDMCCETIKKPIGIKSLWTLCNSETVITLKVNLWYCMAVL